MIETRKFNPGFLSDDALVAGFCARENSLESILETVHENQHESNQHVLVIGTRGSGKSTLLLRVAAETRRNAEFADNWYPIVFSEESYEVASCGEFWLDALFHLADELAETGDDESLMQAYEELRSEADDQNLADRCLGRLLDFADSKGKRLLLVVENLNMMYDQFSSQDAGWSLRHTLQNDSRIMLLASATSRFDGIDNSGQPFYELFRIVPLKPLTTKECTAIWEKVSGVKSAPGTIKAIKILTGGSPRLVSIIARYGARRSFKELMDDLLDLVDEHTEYFKSHLEMLPPQERRVYLALADLWKPASAKEVAERARLSSSQASAQLKRLMNRGVVIEKGGRSRRKYYYLAERMYNIYYLLRRRSGSERMVRALIDFMTAYFPKRRWVELGKDLVDEAMKVGDGVNHLHYLAYRELFERMTTERERKNLLDATPDSFLKADAAQCILKTVLPQPKENEIEVLQELMKRLEKLKNVQQMLEELDCFIAQLNTKDKFSHCAALITKGMLLEETGENDAALVIFDEVLERLNKLGIAKESRLMIEPMARKSNCLIYGERYEEAIIVCDELLERCSSLDEPELYQWVARALLNKGVSLEELGRNKEVTAPCDELLKRFGLSEDITLQKQVAKGLNLKAINLLLLGQYEEADTACGELMERFAASTNSALQVELFRALCGRAVVCGALDKKTQSLQYISQYLELLPNVEISLDAVIEHLKVLVIFWGEKALLDVLVGSPSEQFLLPLVVALKQACDQEVRVAVEVEEVARDITDQLKEMRKQFQNAGILPEK